MSFGHGDRRGSGASGALLRGCVVCDEELMHERELIVRRETVVECLIACAQALGLVSGTLGLALFFFRSGSDETVDAVRFLHRVSRNGLL